MLRKKCTRDYKVDPINRGSRAILGIQEARRVAERRQWRRSGRDVHRGRATHEDHRHSGGLLMTLIEMGMSRTDCLRWLESNAF